MKRCSKCKEEKSVDCFYKDSRAKDGFCSRCKSCDNRLSKRTYWRDPAESRRKNKEKRKRQSAWWIAFKKMLSCSKCGEKRWYVLDFHHADKNKEFSVSALRENKEKCMAEAKKCQVLCSNCHRELHFLERERQDAGE